MEQREITNQGGYRIQTYEQFYRWQEEATSVDTKLATYPPAADLPRTLPQTNPRGC